MIKIFYKDKYNGLTKNTENVTVVISEIVIFDYAVLVFLIVDGCTNKLSNTTYFQKL